MKLFQVPPSHVGIAWRDGAQYLAEATKHAEREITASQLKTLLLRGERTLVGIADDSNTPKAWAAVQIQTLPNLRTLFIYCMWAPGQVTAECFRLLKEYAKQNGCETIRGASIESIGRIWEAKCNAKRIYSIYEMEVD